MKKADAVAWTLGKLKDSGEVAEESKIPGVEILSTDRNGKRKAIHVYNRTIGPTEGLNVALREEEQIKLKDAAAQANAVPVVVFVLDTPQGNHRIHFPLSAIERAADDPTKEYIKWGRDGRSKNPNDINFNFGEGKRIHYATDMANDMTVWE